MWWLVDKPSLQVHNKYRCFSTRCIQDIIHESKRGVLFLLSCPSFVLIQASELVCNAARGFDSGEYFEITATGRIRIWTMQSSIGKISLKYLNERCSDENQVCTAIQNAEVPTQVWVTVLNEQHYVTDDLDRIVKFWSEGRVVYGTNVVLPFALDELRATRYGLGPRSRTLTNVCTIFDTIKTTMWTI